VKFNTFETQRNGGSGGNQPFAADCADKTQIRKIFTTETRRRGEEQVIGKSKSHHGVLMTKSAIPNEHENVSLDPAAAAGPIPQGPIWLLCPFTPKSGREWGPENAAKSTDLSGWQLSGRGIFVRGMEKNPEIYRGSTRMSADQGEKQTLRRRSAQMGAD